MRKTAKCRFSYFFLLREYSSPSKRQRRWECVRKISSYKKMLFLIKNDILDMNQYGSPRISGKMYLEN